MFPPDGPATQCTSTVIYKRKFFHCHFSKGHKADGEGVFDTHVAKQGRRTLVWTDRDNGRDITDQADTAPSKQDDSHMQTDWTKT